MMTGFFYGQTHGLFLPVFPDLLLLRVELLESQLLMSMIIMSF